ncbi:MAG: flavodoxin family protein [Fervidicoccaceae archaeon]
MPIRVLGINSSPRRTGGTSALLAVALEAARAEGATTEVLHLADLNLRPCEGCVSEDELKCRYPCPIEDDGRKLYEALLRSHGIVVATPIYWFNVSGLLKNAIDRMTVLENMLHFDGRSWLEGKVCGFIAIGSDAGAIAVIQNLMAVFNSFGALIPPWALAYHESPSSPLANRKALLDAANVGRVVVLAARMLNEGERAPRTWYRADPEYLRLLDEIVAKVGAEHKVLKMSETSCYPALSEVRT